MTTDFTIEICTSPQGSDEWKADRAGVITASNYKLFFRERLKSGANKGEYKADAKKYAYELAFERATGQVIDTNKYETPYMVRGREQESCAREAHEIIIDHFIEEVGLLRTTDRRFGVSVDGFIGTRGGAEYKCFTDANKVADVLINDATDEVIAQVQGGMWLSGREWWHYGLYHPALSALGQPIKIIEIERDEAFIEELEEEAVKFDRYVEGIKQQILDASGKALTLKYPATVQPAAKAVSGLKF